MANILEDTKYQYNFLGKSGLRVSNICLGAMTFGGVCSLCNTVYIDVTVNTIGHV